MTASPKTDELVERIARALATNAFKRSIERTGPGFMMREYPNAEESYADKEWQKYAEDARACLSAIESAGLVIVPRDEWDACSPSPNPSPAS